MTEPVKGELAETINNIVAQNNKKLLEEISKLMGNHFEKLEKSNLDNNLFNSVSVTQILQQISVLENAIGEKKKSIKTTTAAAKSPTETGGEAVAVAPAPVAKKPANKMAYFKNRMLVDNEYYNSVVKQVDAILNGKSQEIENSPAVVSKKPNERRKAICAAYWTLISPGKELKVVLDNIEKEYKDLKSTASVELKQPITAQLDKDKQSDEE